MKILVVDDDTGTLNALKASLISVGYQVEVAEGASQALKILRNAVTSMNNVDLMLTDLKMPDMNGLELIRFARKESPGLKTLLMTAHGTGKTQKALERIGSCGYLEKPFSPGRALYMIKQFLKPLAKKNTKQKDPI